MLSSFSLPIEDTEIDKEKKQTNYIHLLCAMTILPVWNECCICDVCVFTIKFEVFDGIQTLEVKVLEHQWAGRLLLALHGAKPKMITRYNLVLLVDDE